MSQRNVTAAAAQLKAAQNHVRGSTNVRAGFSKARPTVPASEMQAFIDWLPTVRRNGCGINFDFFPRSIDELWRFGMLAPATLVREVAWASAVFSKHAKTLGAFRTAARQYELSLVEDRYDDCRAQLGDLERDFGVSLWTIETRIALLQRSGGLEAQKGYAAQIRKARGKNDIVAYLAYQLSRRNEPNTTSVRYVQQLEDAVEGWKEVGDLSSYVLHRLGNRMPSTAGGYAAVLRLESNAALVDHYETFVRLGASAGAAEEGPVRSAFRQEVCRLAGLVDDVRLRRAAFLLSGDGGYLDSLPVIGVRVEDALVHGVRDSASALALAEIVSDPVDATAWIVAARASLLDGTVIDGSVDLRSAVIDRAGRLSSQALDADDALATLSKDALNHRLQGFAPAIDAFVLGEIFVIPGPSRHIEALAFAYGGGLRPSDVGRVSNADAVRAIATRLGWPGVQSSAVAVQLLRADVALDEDCCPAADELPPDVILEAEIVRSLGRNDYGRVLGLAERLSSTSDVMRRRRAKRYLSHSLLATDRIPDLASLIARSCVADPALARLLPVRDCARRLDRGLRRDRAGDLSIPIVLDFFSKGFEDGLNDVRSYAYEDFLLAHGMERPSQLAVKAGDFDCDLLVHYLRHLCVPDVMQVSSAFQGTRELEEERKKVLSLLVKLNPEAAKDYESELRELTRAQLIHRGVRQVERSKIYVDVPAIKRAFEKKHRETFQRYQALSRAGIGMDDRELEAALREVLAGKPLPAQVLEVPQNELNDLLLQMLRWLFTEGTSSPEH